MSTKGWSWLILLVAATSSQAATKLTVEQLKETLVSLRQEGKSDAEVTSRLKEMELTEELTFPAKNKLLQYLPGDSSTEQLSILQGRSAFLTPQADPAAPPAPDAAAQKAILDKATAYAGGPLSQLPALSAVRTTSRYQDDVVNSSSSPGLTLNGPNTFAKLSDAKAETVDIENGVEKPEDKTKESWGQNGQISGPGPFPALKQIFREASEGGKLKWERWETADGKRLAVFSFVVDKKKSHYDVSYCCFPKTETQTGIASAGTFAPLPGQIQSLTTWKPFKRTVGYHGEISIEPESGAILSLLVWAELKPTDYVHQEAVRVDYRPLVVNGKEYILPLDSFVLNEVVPAGDSQTTAYSVRHGLFNVTYTNYRVH